MGILYVVATPVGNLEDITIRAIKVLLQTEVIACEDTRHTGQLLKQLEINPKFQIPSSKQEPNSNNQLPKKYISVRDFNESDMVEKVLFALQLGDVALVSDAGTPLLSDPGYKIVKAARAAGFTVSPVPGAFAGAVALSAAGLPTNKFLFWGFLPKHWELEPEMTHVIYEAPVRLEKTLAVIKDRYPTADIVVANELTKIHEAFIPYTGQALNLKGEAVILVYWKA